MANYNTSNYTEQGGAKTIIGGELEISSGATFDCDADMDMDGAIQLDGTFTVGVNDTGYDVKFFGASDGAYLLWDESADRLEIDGGQSELIRFVASGDGGITIANDNMNADPETATEDGKITVVVNATSYEIPVYAAA